MTESVEPLNILAVDDDPGSVREIESAVNDPLLRFHFADTANALSRTIEAQPVDLAVIHLHDGSEALLDPLVRLVRAASPPIALIALTAPEAGAALAAATCGVNGCARMDDPESIQRVVDERASQIRRQRAQAQSLEQSSDIHERYNLLLESSSEAIAYLHEGLHIYANPSYLALFGYPDFDAIEGFSVLDLLSSPDGHHDIKQLLRSLSRGELPSETLEFTAHRSDGAEFQVDADFAPAHYEGETCTQIMVRERIEADDSAKLQQEIEKLRSRDLLTGLLNRQAFIGTLNSELAEPPDDRHVAILLAAVDDQEALQHKVGAAAPDLIMRQSADAFGEIISEDMLPARLSDHVLAARIRFADRDEATSMATRVVETFSGRILEIRDKSPSITASVGLAIGGSHHFSADELLSQAETALRETQRAGGNSYMRYRPGSAASEDTDVEEWAERLRHALNNGDFRLVRLPITSMEDDSFMISEFETRLREEGSDEIIMPSTFQPAANASGLAADLDRDLIESLVRWCGNNPEMDGEMLVPLSVQGLTDPEFSEELQQLVDDGTLEARKLILGFQESEVRENLRELQRLVSRMGARGVRFALLGVMPDSRIDLVLKNVHVDYLKLAGNLDGALRNDQQQQAALEKLVAEAAANEAQVIAPQVENTSDLAALWQFGITLIQDDFVRDEE